jgi:hypothetical protein
LYTPASVTALGDKAIGGVGRMRETERERGGRDYERIKTVEDERVIFRVEDILT